MARTPEPSSSEPDDSWSDDDDTGRDSDVGVAKRRVSGSGSRNGASRGAETAELECAGRRAAPVLFTSDIEDSDVGGSPVARDASIAFSEDGESSPELPMRRTRSSNRYSSSSVGARESGEGTPIVFSSDLEGSPELPMRKFRISDVSKRYSSPMSARGSRVDAPIIFTSDLEGSPKLPKPTRKSIGKKTQPRSLDNLFSDSEDDAPPEATIASSPPVITKPKPKPVERNTRRSKYDVELSTDSSDSGDENYLSAVHVRVRKKSVEECLEELFEKTTLESDGSFIVSDHSIIYIEDTETEQAEKEEMVKPREKKRERKYSIVLEEEGIFSSADENDEKVEITEQGTISDDYKTASVEYHGPIKKPLRSTTPDKSFSSGIPEQTSPTKRFGKIPPTPHRHDSDEFWDQTVVNDWNDQHSPVKKIPLGDIVNIQQPINTYTSNSEYDSDASIDSFIVDDDERLIRRDRSPTTSSRSITKKAPVADAKARKAFNAIKTQVAESFLKELDETLYDGAVGRFYPDGITLRWNPRLTSTAGQALLRNGIIELSTKVITTLDRLYDTTAHEYCHLAVWVTEAGSTRRSTNGKREIHGPAFKAWGRKASAAFKRYNIKVTTTHMYEVEHKYEATCQTPGCGWVWKSHSRFKELERWRCPFDRNGAKCKGVLLQTKPAPRAMSEYNVFTKQHMARVKRENPGMPHKGIMSIIGKEWKEYKSRMAPDETGAETESRRSPVKPSKGSTTINAIEIESDTESEPVEGEDDIEKDHLGDLLHSLKVSIASKSPRLSKVFGLQRT